MYQRMLLIRTYRADATLVARLNQLIVAGKLTNKSSKGVVHNL